MKVAGIIAEYNPFHSGHGYLIEQARASGADCVVCVMSGYFTQRGEAAIADPYFRSRALLYGGADLVLELPYPYSSSSAEFFAGAGVDILSRLSVDELWFGSECGDLTLLQRGADASLDEVFLNLYEKEDEDFIHLINDFCMKDDKNISKLILDLSSKLDLIPDKKSFLNSYLDNYYTEDNYKKLTDSYINIIHSKLEALGNFLEEISYQCEPEKYEEVLGYYSNLLTASSYEDIRLKSSFDSIPFFFILGRSFFVNIM